jgi:hypothetical protein
MQSAILKSAAMSLVLSLAVLIIYPATFSNIASAGTSDPGQDKGGPGNLQPHYFYNFGTAVTGGVRCDLDGDGISDFIVGAPMTDRARGAVYVFSGENGHLLGVVRGEASGDRLGYCVACGGDVNQDGANDVVAGAPGCYRSDRNDRRGKSIPDFDEQFATPGRLSREG